uniref:Transcription factor 20 n=1 Tax=Paramormyrops kingsleyae TaxID=1676925 RepID=A0A3B3RZU5_9TELE
MPNEHAEVQQQTPRNTQNQHTHHQMSLHSSHASLMQGYGARSRGGGGGKGLQGSHLSENPYQKEAIDYYMSVSGKQSSRRGSQGLEYGVSFGYSDVGGQVPHQYRHAGNGPGSSVMSHYQLDYTASAATGGNTFSPTHQYCLSQNPSVQSTPGHQMHPRQQGQDYSSHQPFPQRQQHRGYPLSGHRPLPQFSRVPLSNASAESARAYNFPPQRYLSGGATSNFECEISNSGSGNSKTGSNHGSVKPSNMAQFDSSRLSYSSSNYPAYDFHTSQSPHKQSVYSHRYTQNNLKPDYDSSNKIISSSLTSCSPYPKYPQASTASSNSHNSSMPQYVSQEIPKSVTQNQQPQVHPNFSPISNPSPAASGIQSPNCSSSPSPLLGASEGLGNSAILRAAPQLSPTPSSNSILTQSQLGRGKICDENYSSLYPSSVDKLTRDPGINSLNALTSQVANIPNTVQHMLLSDSLISKNRGKDEPAYETGEHYQMLQNSHGLAANQEGSKTMSNSCSDSATRTVRMDMGGAQPDSGMNESTEVVKREGEENSSGGGDSMTRQTSGTSTESGYNHSSQNLAKQGLPLELVVGASKIKRQTLAFPRGNEHSIHSTSSSSPSSLPSSVEPSPNIPPPCTLSSFTSTSVSPSPTLKSPKEPIVRSIDRRNCNKLQENYDANGRKKKNQADQDITVTLEGSRSDMPRIGNDKLESHDKRKAEEAQKGSTTLSGKVEDCEKIVKTQNLDNPHKILKTGETQNTGGVGVIVSTRSEMTEHNTLLESPQGAPSAPQHLDNELQNSQNSTDKIHSSNAFKDARCVNGQGGGSICTLPSVNGTNIPPEPSYEQSPSCHHSGKQRSPYGYSELVGSMMDLKKAGSIETSTGKEANLRYESQHQPPLSYIPGQKKGMVPTGIMKLGRRGTIRDQDINPPVQQSSASILQEVLQGYHTEKTYDHTKNSVNVPDTHPQSQNMAHNLSRHSYGVSKSMMPRSLVPQTGLSQDHQASLPAAVPVKDYPLNLKQSSTTGIGQDPPPTSWAPVGMGRAHGESSGKSKMATSPNRPAAILPETTESSQQPPLKNINLADYLLPHRIPFTNPQTSSSAVQQLLLQDTEPIGGSDLPVKKPPMASSSSSSERCSVICDVSLQSTPEKEKDRHEDEVKETCKETGYTGASVIQQSHSTTLEGLQDNSKENKSEVKMETECSASKEVFSQNDNPTLYCGQLPEKKSAFRQQSRSPYTSVNTSTDNHSLSTGENRHINVSNVNPSHFHQAPRTLSSNLNLQASPSTRCQSNYPGIDGCGSHSGYGFENFRERSHFLSQIPPQHDIPSKFQFGNSQPNKKLQMYSHSHPHQYSQDTDDKREWEALHKNRISKDMMVSSSSGSSSQQYRSQAGMSSQASHSDPAGQPKLLHQQFSRQGSYYDMKIWNLSQSGREGGGTLECTQPVFQTNQTGVVTPGSDTSRGVTEKVKSFPSVPSSQKPSAHGSFAGSTVNLGTQQGRSPVKTERAGETNPLMMRRRVRSFISPIPAKRQHQDLPQQQRSTQTLYPSPLSNTASRHHDTGPSSPDVPHSGMAIPDANCNKLAQNMMLTSPSSQGKTNILPPRKGRGLKLEAIVQKITPNVKNNRSLTDFACTPLTGSSHTDLVHYNSDNQEQESCIGDSLSESVTGHGSSHSYLDEGLSLEEIMSYKDFYGPSSFHHNQHQRQCLLPRHPNSLQIHQQSPFGQTLSSMSNSSQLNELKPLETVVPKGYFPSGKKKGRPVGSVNKQKRAQVQSQNASINASPVISTPIQIPGPTATAETIPKEKQQKRRRRVGGLMGKEILQACAGTEEKCATGIFQDNRKSVFSPYIHVERKQEIGAVCTIVNEEQEKSKGEKKEGVKSCTAGKTIPLSGYVLSGPVSTETGNSGQLLCCLCKKWANYKNLGDLYGPYYPPEYVASLPKNHPQIRNSLGTAKLGNKGADLGTCTTESTKQDTQQIEPQIKLTSHPRFKRRHRPGDDLPKTTQSNFKTSLPFQPPPQLLNQDPSEPLAHLAQLPEVPLDHNELWVHEGCIAWASGVFLVNGRLYGLQEALDGAMDTSCSYCEQVGAALGCYSKGCSLRCHYVCAIADCSLNEENFSLRCPKHKVI